MAASFAMAAPNVMAQSGQGYLNWANKTQAAAPQYQTPQAYAPAPSPYGQVGNPYVRALNWPAKNAPPRPEPIANIQPNQAYYSNQGNSAYYPMPTPGPVHQPQSYAMPAPLPQAQPPRLEPNALNTIPMTSSAPPNLKPSSAPKSLPNQRQTPSHFPSNRPAEVQNPQPVTQNQVSASQQNSADDSGYKIPTTSKYYRNKTASKTSEAKKTDSALAQKSKPMAMAKSDANSAPVEKSDIAQEQVDGFVIANPEGPRFVPGASITDEAAQTPRRYSLHREYGMNPDAIPQPNAANLDPNTTPSPPNPQH